MTIVLNGQKMQVRKNLWTFLRILRDRFCPPGSAAPSVRMWADYLCIDQSSIQERNYQVPLMGELYRNANVVYAFLGDTIMTADGAKMRSSGDGQDFRSSSNQPLELTRAQLRTATTSTYWTRMWIKQEVLLAKDLWFLVGQGVIAWSDLQQAIEESSLDVVGNHHDLYDGFRYDGSPLAAQNRQTIHEMISLLQARGSFEPARLSQLVHQFRESACEDSRDRIYALLSLLEAEEKEQVKVDYTMPLLEVLLENYRHWAGEYATKAVKTRDTVRDVVHEFRSFTTNMNKLLSLTDLLELRRSHDLRRSMSALALFLTSQLRTVTSVSIIAIVNTDNARNRDTPNAKGRERVIGVMAIETSSSDDQGEIASLDFVYASKIPRPGMFVASIGGHYLLLQRHQETEDDDRPFAIEVFAGGARMGGWDRSTMATARLCSCYFPHPSLWSRQQLEDTDFQVSTTSDQVVFASASQALGKRLHVRCNAAAMVSLLSEARELELKTAGPPEYDTEAHLERPKESSTSSSMWSPYDFGLKHGILDACRTCQVLRAGFVHVNDAVRQPDVYAEPCQCRWKARQM